MTMISEQQSPVFDMEDYLWRYNSMLRRQIQEIAKELHSFLLQRLNDADKRNLLAGIAQFLMKTDSIVLPQPSRFDGVENYLTDATDTHSAMLLLPYYSALTFFYHSIRNKDCRTEDILQQLTAVKNRLEAEPFYH